MATYRTTDATLEPLTIEQAKRHLREDLVDPDNDADIAACITAARLDAEFRLQRTLITSTWRHTLDAFPSLCSDYKDGAIRLPMGRTIAVTSVKYVDDNGTLQTLAADQYLVDASGDVARITPAYGLSWPSTRVQPGAVQVNYTAGYGSTAATVPAPIVSWIKLAMSDLYGQRGRSAERPMLPHHFADGLLDGYRIWSL
jgi:uncharacterized phiE125 gp8 family phage protein